MDTVKLFQITDTHCYSDDASLLGWTEQKVYPNHALRVVLTQLMAQLDSQHQALFITGDLAQQEVAATYQRVWQLLARFPLPIYVMPGNHDQPALMRQYLLAPIHYMQSVRYGRWYCLALDTSRPLCPDGHLSELDYNVLTAQLDLVADDEYVAIFMHHHPLPIGSAWMDKMGLQQPEQFWQLLARYPQVKVIFHGHIHQEFAGEYVFRDGRTIQVYGTAATCVQLRPVTPDLAFDHTLPAWRDITLHADGMVETMLHYLSATPSPLTP